MKFRAKSSVLLACILIAAILSGCVSVYRFRPRVSVMPISGADDPEKPQRPPECSGLILSVTDDSMVLQPVPKRRQPGEEDGEPETGLLQPTADPETRVTITVPLLSDVRIRQSRAVGKGQEFTEIKPYEVVPGMHADVWLNDKGVAEYICIFARVRMRN